MARRYALLSGIAAALGSVAAVAATGAGLLSSAPTPPPADKLDPFSSISAATASPGASSRVGSAMNVRLAADFASSNPDISGRVMVERSVVLANAVVGGLIRVTPTTKNRLCVSLDQIGSSCGSPLESKRPAVVAVSSLPETAGAGSVVYGVAMDGVSEVDLIVSGRRVVVPVSGNTFSARISATSDEVTAAEVVLDGTRRSLP